jgi:HD-like signal output (HDOD) protein/ActR/RegA family two-component response regulator
MKKRILFVEDDPFQLQMYAMMLEDEKARWEIVTASDARDALQMMERAPFDVVVSDLVMPRMDGAELMAEVQKRFPRSARIILSLLSDQERVAHCLGTTHQFISKPFDVKVLRTTLARIGGLDNYLKNEGLKVLVGQLGALPSFPSLYLDITRELNSLDASIERVASIIARDPGMTAKMLQIVNSAAIGLARRISSPFEAVQFLGMRTVRSLVLSAHIFSCFAHADLKGFSVDQLWAHGLKTGQIACTILQLEQAEPADIEDAYIAAMLHDIGKLMLADSLPKQFQQALGLAAERKIPLYEAEQSIFRADHAGVAAYLLGLWGLPASLVEAIAFHHQPSRSDLKVLGPLAAVHVANVLEHELTKAPIIGEPSQIDKTFLSEIGVANRLDAWRAEAAKTLKLQER